MRNMCLRLSSDAVPAQVMQIVEAVEKVPKQILGQDAEKSDLIECATINDLQVGKGKWPLKTVYNSSSGLFRQARYALLKNERRSQRAK